jgi:hypothetical protein
MNETPLLDQIRFYSEALVEDLPSQPTRTEDGVDSSLLPAATRNRAWAVAVAAAVVTVVVLGGVAWLAPLGSDAPPAQEPTVVTTLPEQVTDPEPETLTDTTVSTTTLTTVAIAPVPPDAFDRLDDALAQAPVYHRYGYEVTAELEYLDGYIESLAESSLWPKPEFDTSALGVESVLIELPPSALTSVPRTIPSLTEDDQPVIEQPLVAGAQLSGTEHAATFFIGIGFKDGTVSPIWRLLFTPSYTQGTVFEEYGGMQWHDMDDQDPPHIILMTGGWSEEFPTVIGGLPPEASVVATTLGDGTRVWQRPISGIAIFLDPSPQCVPSDGTPLCSAEFIVLNANGNEILRLTWADGDLHPIGFTVTGP